MIKIEHIALYAENLEAMRDFFVRYLGARSNEGYHNPKTGFRSYFLSFGNGARMEIMQKPGVVPAGLEGEVTGYAHVAFSVGSKEQVDVLTRQLAADGFTVSSGPRTTGDGYYESSVVGLEGNLIEITV